MQNPANQLIKNAVKRRSSLHSTSMHNAIQKLAKKPLTHKKGREAIEKSIIHLMEIHNVQITERMRELLKKAQPSQNLMQRVQCSV